MIGAQGDIEICEICVEIVMTHRNRYFLDKAIPLGKLIARHFLSERAVILSRNAVEVKDLGRSYSATPDPSVVPMESGLLQNDMLMTC